LQIGQFDFGSPFGFFLLELSFPDFPKSPDLKHSQIIITLIAIRINIHIKEESILYISGYRTAKTNIYTSKKSMYNNFVSVLYIVATPIGNLGDITYRALETFKTVDVIAAEDTRHTLQLLTHFEIRKPLISCRSQNEEIAAKKIISLLDEGKNVAFASDAGTPGISDPGAILVKLTREAGHTVVPIPGASAFATLLSVAGPGGKTVIFEGFLSPKPGRRRARLRELMATGWAFVLYESPFRIVKLLADIADIEYERHVVVGRELTKLHEEIVEGSAGQVQNDFSSRSKILGEFAVFVSGNKSAQLTEEDTDKKVRQVEDDDR
jgi:16S rRNA (cytidine1402-2'-O)-methyltransferase